MKRVFAFFTFCCLWGEFAYAADASIFKLSNISSIIKSVVPSSRQAAVESAYKEINGNYITTTDMVALCDIAFGDVADMTERLNGCVKLVDGFLGGQVCSAGNTKVILGGRCPNVVDAVERILNGNYVSNKTGGCMCYARDCTAGFVAVRGLCARESELEQISGIAPKCLAAWRKYAPANQSFDDFFRIVCKDEATLQNQIAKWDEQGESGTAISEEEYKRRRQELDQMRVKTYADFLKIIEDTFNLELARNGCKHHYTTTNQRVDSMYKAYNNKAAQLWAQFSDTRSLTKEQYDAQLYRLKTNAIRQVQNAISREAIERHATKMSSTVVGALKEDRTLFEQAKNFANLSDNDKLAFGTALIKKIAPRFGTKALPIRGTNEQSVRGYFSIGSVDIHMNLKAFKDVSAYIATLTHEYSHYIDVSCPDDGALGRQLGLFSQVIYTTSSANGADSVSQAEAFDVYMHTFTEQSSQRLGWEVEEAVRALFR